MHSKKRNFTAILLLSAAILTLASCATEKKADSGNRMTSVNITPGEAGGVFEDTFSDSATVAAIDHSSRYVTLETSNGHRESIKAGPEIRNLDQIKVGDKVRVTITEQFVVFVRSQESDPSVTHAAAVARAPKGARPGAIVAETYELVAKVKAIDSAKRIATLEFTDGYTKDFPIRADVDLSRYKVGDTVVIRITDTITVIVQSS